MANVPTHPTWCVPARCDAINPGGAHRGELISVDGTETTVLISLRQSTIGAPKILLSFNGWPPVLLDLGQANLVANHLADLVVAAGIR